LQVKAHPTLADILRYFWTFQKYDGITCQEQAAADVGADSAGAKHQHF
jgi:hypothetical protein